MLSIEQCRGARGILGWTQQDLADASGLSKTAINNFEKGHSDIKAESLKAIRTAFEIADIEFLEQNGLRKKSEDMVILRGTRTREDLFTDIMRSVDGQDSDILIISKNKLLFDELPEHQAVDHIEMLKRNNIKQRVICCSDSAELKTNPAQLCRTLPRETLESCNTTYIYDGKVAIEMWEDSIIVVISSHDVHFSERSRFEKLWNLAK